ncbi:hypothetical protein HYH03_003510 [Edaphochlamys debaryana]|uniref:Autophagy-related protein 9 n=1 Tax=Edaphochlamys debaryana TaxID=47281 RepID=A0A835YDC3_9CHLO|nr:hypothetical protein HYH03_003510 [Edaphochlamys debaryana]|eukprot:KAG2498771.1 hypothetical protein HYH03_003510 [Edaphochlamys debaryana]
MRCTRGTGQEQELTTTSPVLANGSLPLQSVAEADDEGAGPLGRGWGAGPRMNGAGGAAYYRTSDRSAADLSYDPCDGAPPPDMETPLLAGGESYEFAAIANLDLFFTRVYRYWHERGLRSMLLSGALNLLALAFTAAFSTFLLLFVDWRALHSECLAPKAGGSGSGSGSGSGTGPGSCDLAAVALDRRPLLGRGLGWDLLALSYIAVCTTYLGWTAAHYLTDARDMREVAHFMKNKLGISERKVVAMTWAEVVHRLVLVQRTTRLCIARDLDELYIVSRIMRKENYLIAMINRDVLQLHLRPPPDTPDAVRRILHPVLRALGGSGACGGAGLGGGGGGGSGHGSSAGGSGGGRGHPPALTKTLEWNLRWCILDHMFDDRFRIRPEFLDVEALRRRLRLVAAANLLLSPFLLMFLLAHFAMRNAERLYHHPAALGSRRWSGLAKWRLRELNELPHYLHHRLSASHTAAVRYVEQFPAHTLAAVARFVVFVTGSFVALLLIMTFLDESLLERPLLGRQVVWWLGTMGLILAACRTLVSEEPVAYDPERALADVVSYTHYLPRHWRGRAHTAEVQAAFLSLFRLKLALFAEEILSLLTTPLLLATSLPACADGIVEFVAAFTTHVDGVGDVCSLAMFDLERHGNTKYGSPVQADKVLRSRQGKLEKSFLTFVATYPSWEPGQLGRQMLAALAARAGGGGGGGSGGGGAAGVPQDPPRAFPYQAAAAAGGDGSGKGKGSPLPADADDAAARAQEAGGAGRGAEVPLRRLGPAAQQLAGPYHGVKSYMSTASASHGSFGGAANGAGPAAAANGWQWRPPGQAPGGSGAAANGLSAGGITAAAAASGAVGGMSPSPSVASSQFSALAPPYMQYYPVPYFHVQQQQARHAQQVRHRRMYDMLLYGGGSAAGPPPPPSPGLGHRVASTSVGGAVSWQPRPYGGPSYDGGLDESAPYSAVFQPYDSGPAGPSAQPWPAAAAPATAPTGPVQSSPSRPAPPTYGAARTSAPGGVTGGTKASEPLSMPSPAQAAQGGMPADAPSAAVGAAALAASTSSLVDCDLQGTDGSDGAGSSSVLVVPTPPSPLGTGSGSAAGGGGGGGGSSSAGCGGGAASASAAGCGSDILDMRGLEDMAAAPTPRRDGAASSGGGGGADDDPLGLDGFVALPPPQPLAAAPGGAANASDPVDAFGAGLADADGFGLVPGALRPPQGGASTAAEPPAQGVWLRRWGPPAGAGGASISGSMYGPRSTHAAWGVASHAVGQPQQAPAPADAATGDAASSSHMYDTADYYAASSTYCGADEYDAMYGYEAAIRGWGAPPQAPLAGRESAAAGDGGGGGGAGGVLPRQPQASDSIHPLQAPGWHGTSGMPYDVRLEPHRFAAQQPLCPPESPVAASASTAGAGAPAAADVSDLRASIFAPGGGNPAGRASGGGGAGGGGSPLAAAAPAAAAATFLTNETTALHSRVANGHTLLHAMYESNDHTVQHRYQQQQHARSVHAGRADGGGGAGTAGGGGWAGPNANAGARGFGWAPPGAGSNVE